MPGRMTCWVAVAVIGVCVGAASAAGPPPSGRLLAALVADLGSDDFDTRREAAERLRGHLAAADLLEEEAARGKDAEARTKAGELLKEIEARRVPARCARIVRLVGEGRLDLLPDHMLRWAALDEKDASFHAVAVNASKLRVLAAGKLAARPRKRMTLSDGDLLLRPWTQRELRARNIERVFADRLDNNMFYNALLVAAEARIGGGMGIYTSAGGLESIRNGMDGAIIIANGDVTIRKQSSYCIVVSDGAIRAGFANRCIFLARKGVTVDSEPSADSVFVGGGKVKIPDKGLLQMTSHVEEDARCPLGLVRFFKVSDVGLTLDGLSVKDAKGALADAGLRKGDAFLSIDGVPVKNAEALRRALRKRYAIDGVGLFTLKRGDKTLTLRARLAD